MGNQQHYGSPDPPSYDLAAITMPVIIFYGDGDGLVSVQDVERLISEMPNVPHSYLVDCPGWNHNDFVYGVDAPELVYDILVGHMQEFVAEKLQ